MANPPPSTFQIDQTISYKPAPTSPSANASPSSPVSRGVSFVLYLRYLLVRIVGVPIPYFSSSIPFLGGRTAIEIIMIAVAFYLGITTALSHFETAGIVTDYLMSITIILGFRNNILTYLFNMSFERVLFWHKTIALLTISTMIIHGYERLSNPSGLPMAVIMILMASLYLIKPYFFELFYYVHVIGVILFIPFGFMHYSKIFQYLLLIWVGDLLIRYLLTMKHIKASARLLPNNIIEIQFPNSAHDDPEKPDQGSRQVHYQAGQYCFIMIKNINIYEFHPFSYSSSPHEPIVKLHIRQVGNWTQQLAQYVQTTAQTMQEINPESATEIAVPIEIYHEGPYGTPMIDLENSVYDVLLLISGGIGVTPLQSLYNHFIHQSSTQQRRFRKVIFIWSVKDRVMVDAMLPHKLHSVASVSSQDIPYLPISFQPPIPPPPAQKSTRVIPMREGSANLGEDQSPLKESQEAVASGVDVISSDLIFHNEYYLTQVRASDSQHTAGIHPEVQKWLKFGRPNLSEIFASTAKLCQAESISRVGVCVCGPTPMVNEVTDLCHSSLLNPSCQGIRFDCHSEVFDF